MNENILCGNELAKNFNKEYGIIVYSVALALESALICSGVKEGDKVLISSVAAYSTLASISKLGAIPVVLIPENGLVLTSKEIKKALEKESNIKCFIVTHIYGIVQNMREIKKALKPDIKVIEDTTNAWNIIDGGYNSGIYSDYVITSLERNKSFNLQYLVIIL